MANDQLIDRYANPYFLHTSDHAGLVLVSDRLTTGADFHSWRRSVRMALNVRNKLGFIDGTILKPSENDSDYGSWSRCNDMVATWLMNSVSKKIGQSLLFISTAEGIWQNLISRFKQDDAPRVYEIEQRLSVIQQGALDVSAYYTELVTLWEEYRNYVEIPLCTCGKCECNAAALWEKLQQRSRVTKFLMGLNDSYEATRRHILMLKPIPTIEDAFNMVTQDERQKNIKPVHKNDNVVFHTASHSQSMVGGESPVTQNQFYYPSYDGSVYTGQNQNQNSNVYQGPLDNSVYAAMQTGFRPRAPRPVCTYCGQTGHVIQKCFKKHGYPPGYIPGFKSSGGYQSQSQSQFGPRPQMQSFNSFQPRAQFSNTRPQSHAIANVVSGSSSSSSCVPSAMNAANMDVTQMSQEQMQSLIQQFNTHAQVSENQVPSPLIASITENGAMDPQSSSGVYSGLDAW